MGVRVAWAMEEYGFYARGTGEELQAAVKSSHSCKVGTKNDSVHASATKRDWRLWKIWKIVESASKIKGVDVWKVGGVEASGGRRSETVVRNFWSLEGLYCTPSYSVTAEIGCHE